MARMREFAMVLTVGACLGAAATASGQVFPTGAHQEYNLLPFGVNQVSTYHQVYLSSLFGSNRVRISELAFATADFRSGEQVRLDVVIRLGYTNRVPNNLSPNLSENPVGAMTEVYRVADRLHTNNSSGPNHFDLVFEFDRPFDYDPLENNLLVEMRVSSRRVTGECSCSANNAGTESSRAFDSNRFGSGADPAALRTRFRLEEPTTIIALSGECPGRMTLTWFGAEPRRTAAILRAPSRGDAVIEGGPCDGTQLGLSEALLVSPPGVFGTGRNGAGTFSVNVHPAACGQFIQMVVFDSGAPPCDTSNVLEIN